MWWHFWSIIGGILLLSIGTVWAVASCAMGCFYPQGSRGPKVRRFLGEPAKEADPHAVENGELSWGYK